MKLLCVALLATSLNAHGGQYRGPGDVVPPKATDNVLDEDAEAPDPLLAVFKSATSVQLVPFHCSVAPVRVGSAPPIAKAAATGGPTGPSAPGRGPQTGGRGSRLGLDLTRWSFWWEFNKDPFIHLRNAVHSKGPQTGSDDFYLGSTRKSAHDSLAPTKEDKLDILATLRRAMKSTNNKDIISACMIAMAKVGMDHPEFKLKDVFKPYLKSLNQEVRETAALALGIAAQTESDELDILIALALGKEVK